MLLNRTGSVMHVICGSQNYGTEQFVLSLTKELDQLGVPVTVMTIKSDAKNFGRIPVQTVDRKSRYDLGFFWRLVRAIRESKPAVVHTHGYHGKIWGRLAARLAGVKSIVHTEHDSNFGGRPIQRAVNTALHRSTDAVVTFSQTLARRLVAEDAVPADRVVVIPNGVPRPGRSRRRALAKIEPPVPEGSKVILQVGRLMKVKNQQLSIRALADLRQRRPNHKYCLAFVGSGEDEAQLRRLAISLGVADIVRFLGYRDDVDELMRRCDALLMTSLNEAMPLTVLEAMYAGLAIVSTPWDGASELLEDGNFGRITPSYEPADVAVALGDWMEDRVASMRAVDAAYAAARSRFDIRWTARQHAALYSRFHVATN
jgi:glycosyltransferase involved in cell wall biosynthesis